MKNVLVIAMAFIALCFVSVHPAEARPHLPFRAARAAKEFLSVPGFPVAAAVAEHVKEGIQRRHQRRVARRQAVAGWFSGR